MKGRFTINIDNDEMTLKEFITHFVVTNTIVEILCDDYIDGTDGTKEQLHYKSLGLYENKYGNLVDCPKEFLESNVAAVFIPTSADAHIALYIERPDGKPTQIIENGEVRCEFKPHEMSYFLRYHDEYIDIRDSKKN